jgi:hypothetical protein
MHRDNWGRTRQDEERQRLEREHPRDRRDFGQADYSDSYGYDPDNRSGYHLEREPHTDDMGQADFSRDYSYDPASRQGYRRDPNEEPGRRDETRSWNPDQEQRPIDTRAARKRGASDRLIWATVCERLDRDRRLDASDIEVTVEDGVVILRGTTQTRDGKRRAEHLAETEGVVDVVNMLRIRGRAHRRFF